MIVLRLKLREEAAEHDRAGVLASLEQLPVSVERLFPGDADAELATLYTVSADDEVAPRALSFLAQSPAVEFAEQEAGRRLVLPDELREGRA